MSDFNEIFRSYATAAPIKREDVQATSQTKRQNVTGYNEAAANYAGVQDSNPTSFVDYFYNTPDYMASNQGYNEFRNDLTAERSPINTVRDTALDIATGAVNSAGGLLSIGADAVDSTGRLRATVNGQPYVGPSVAINRVTQAITGFGNSLKSDEADGYARAYEAQADASEDRNTRLRDAEIAAGDNGLVAGARRLGRDALDTIVNNWNNPNQALSGVAQGSGSLLIGGPVSKGATALVSAGAKGLAARGLISGGAARAATEAMEHGSMALTIAGMEMGAAGNQAITEVMGMSHDDLLKNSDYYASLIAQGISQQRAKEATATQASSVAQAVQGPVAALTGGLVAKFEADVFAGRGVKEILKNIGNETLEESIQESSGQFATNLGVRARADRTQELTEGVGRSFSEGGLYGMGTAVGLQAPTAAVRLPIDTAIVASQWAKNALGSVSERGQNIRQTAEDTRADVSTADINTSLNTAVNAAPEAVAAVQATMQEQNAPIEQVDQLSALVEQSLNAGRFNPETVADLSPLVQETVQNSESVFDGIRNASIRLLKDSTLNDEQKAELGYYIDRTMNQNSALADEAMLMATELLPDGHPALDQVTSYAQAIQTARSHPQVQRAMAQGVEAFKAYAKPENVTGETINTPTGQMAVRGAVEIAKADPAKSDPEVLTAILEHSDYEMAEPDRATLRGSLSLVTSLRDREAVFADLGIAGGNASSVALDIQLREGQGNKGPSANTYAKNIIDAASRGDADEASRVLGDLKLFAEHLSNKTAAVNESFMNRQGKSDSSVPFQALNSRTRKFFESSHYVQAGNANSVTTAQQIGVDASTVASIYNGLIEAFPELGGEQFTPVPLASALMAGSARDIVSSRNQRPTDETVQTQQSPTVDTVATPEVSTVADTQAQSVERVEEVAEPQAEATTENTDVAQAEEITPERAAEMDRQIEEFEVNQQPRVTEQEEASATEPTTTETVIRPVEEVYPALIQDKDGNKFTASFKTPTKVISRLYDLDNAFSNVEAALKSTVAYEKFSGKRPTKLSGRVISAYGEYLSEGRTIAKAMQSRVTSLFTQGKNGKASPSDRLAKSNVLSWRAFKNSNLLVQNQKGDYVYEPKVLQQSILAAMDWNLNAMARQGMMDQEQIAKMLNTDENNITPDMMSFFNAGVYAPQAAEELAQQLVQFWGVTPDANALKGYTDGIPQSLAAELLASMAETDLIDIVRENIVYPDRDGVMQTRTYTQVRFNADGLPKSDTETVSPLMAYPDAIASLVLEERDAVRPSIGEEITTTPRTQLRNSLVEITEEQKTVIEREQAVPHFFNAPMFNFVEKLEKAAVLKLFGTADVETRVMNVNHKKTVEGRNLGIAAAYDELMALKAGVDAYAEVNNSEAFESPIYYPYAPTSVNRLQMMGRYNPQSNKLMREVVMPTQSVLDLTDPAGPHMRVWMLGLAQALGVKIHKLMDADWMAALDAKIQAPKMQAAIDALIEFNNSETVDDSVVDMLHAALGTEPDVVAVHALMDYARFLTADDLSTFNTSVYVEADGVTDGPVNAMWHLSIGEFTERWIDNMGRGGMYLDGSGVTLNDHISAGGNNKKDLYEVATDTFKGALSDLRNTLEADSVPVSRQMNAVLFMMTSLLPNQMNFDKETGALTIDRGVAKNPLTITVYGSSANGIAGKVTKELADAMYERMSNAIQRMEYNKIGLEEAFFMDQTSSPEEAKAKYLKFTRGLELLSSKKTGKSKSGKYFTSDVPLSRKDSSFGNAETFTIPNAALDTMRTNLLTLFINPLRDSIEAEMGTALKGASLVQRATSAMSEVAKIRFTKLVDEVLEQRKAEGRTAADFLTQTEVNQLRRKMTHLMPYIRTESQNYLIGGAENVRQTQATVGASMDELIETNVSISALKSAGVSGIPFLNIGFGDGQMIQNLALEDTGGHLYVFDGANFGLGNVERDGQYANKAVYDAWFQGNPMASVRDAFNSFMKDATVDGFSEAELAVVTKAALGQSVDIDAMDALKIIQAEVSGAADQTTARKAVLARLNMSVDHMASLQSPHTATGLEDLSALSSEGKKDRMNEMLEEELAKLNDNKAAKAEVIDLEAGLLAKGELDEASGTKVLDTRRMPEILQGVRIPASHREMIMAAAQTLSGEEFKIVIGNAEGLTKYAEGRGFPLKFGPNTFGMASIPDRVLYLATGSTETLAHEMIHAATLTKVFNAYANPESTTPEVRDAVSRLEVLMNEWIESRSDIMSLRNSDTALAYENALTAVRLAMFNPNFSPAAKKAAALNEFMAWNLSNQDLIRIGKDMTVRSTVARITRQAIDAIKALFGLKMRVDNTVFSNIRFNTRIIMSAGIPTVSDQMSDMALEHSASEHPNDRLQRIRVGMAGAIKSFGEQLDGPARRVQQKGTAQQDYADAVGILERVEANGFQMTKQESSAFIQMMAAFQADQSINPSSMRGLDRVHRQVLDKLTVEMLMADPLSTNPNDRTTAQQQYDLLTGATQFERDASGRSNVLPIFASLAATNEALREVLSNIDITYERNRVWGTADNVLMTAGTEMLERLNEVTTGLRAKDKTVTEAVTRLVDLMAVNVEAERTIISDVLDKASDLMNLGNDKIVDAVSFASDKAILATDMLKAKAKGTKYEKVANLSANGAALLAGAINKNRASEVAMGVMNYIDGAGSLIPQVISDAFNEIVGMTDDNAAVVEMVKYVKTMVQQTRQQYREQLPRTINGKFKTKLDATQQKHLFSGLAKSDLAVFEGRRIDPATILSFIADDAKLQTEVAQLESEVNTLDSVNANRIMTKAQELAVFMNTGVLTGANPLRNALQVANLFGEGKQGGKPASDALVRAVDELKSLYAIRGLDSETKKSLTELIGSEKEGMVFALSYLIGQRKDELNKPMGTARINHIAGYTPTEREGSFAVMEDSRRSELEARGYVRVADYVGSTAEPDKVARGYYSSNIGTASFNQGIFQNVRPTVFGVDTTLGHITDGMSAGMIVDPDQIALIQKRIAANGRNGETLMPHYNEDGGIIAYERSMNPALIEQYAPAKDNFAGSLGMWRGRQVEEALGNMMNLELLKRLQEMSKDMPEDNEGFVDLMAYEDMRSDPVIRDAVRLLSPTVKEYVKDKMDGQLWVRRSLVSDAVGYRNPSIGDTWTGVSRASKEHRVALKDVLTGVFGVNAYQNLVKAERTWQGLMSDARVLIVVKSVIVPMANMVSNVYQLMTAGVPMHRIAIEAPKKTAEITEFLQGQERRVRLEAELRAATASNDSVAAGKLSRQIQGIRDMNRRLSIWPLINAGEFTSVSEGLDREELMLLTKNKLWDYIAAKADKLPTPLKTAGRYALVTKDTALFQGLAKATAYGDFIAKAILYDDLIKKGRTTEDAMRFLSEEFVNYDRLPGRTRTYLEKMGLLWFWNFKIRIMKVAARTMRENPLHLLMATLLPAPSLVGLPTEDNLLSIAMENKLGMSVGPQQAFRSFHLNPWMSIFG